MTQGNVAGRLILPEIGEIVTGRELGKKNGRKYIWLPCVRCKQERWVTKEYFNKKGSNILCRACFNRKLGDRMKGKARKPGARRFSPGGYILIRLSPDDFFFCMADIHGYVAEHRLVMAKHLNRGLLPWEVVHHKNGVKTDNRLDNLKLFSIQSQHVPYTQMKNHIRFLQRRVIQLEAEVTLLRAQIEEAKRYG